VVPETAADSINTGYLSGQYACYASDYYDSGVTVGSYTFYQGGSVFSVKANGSGSITGGEIDSNSPDKGYKNPTANGTLSGSYAVGSDNRGYLLITPQNGSTKYYALAGGKIQNGNFSTIALTDMSDAGASPSGKHGSGLCYKQNTAALSGSTGAYVFTLRGEDAAGIPQAAASQISTVSSAVSGEMDLVDNKQLTTFSLINGSVTNPTDTYGRITLNGGTNPLDPVLVGYLTNDSLGHAFFMYTNPHNESGNLGLMIGEARAQSSSITSGNYPLTGAAVLYIAGHIASSTGNETPGAALVQVSGNSSGDLTMNASVGNSDGTITTTLPLTQPTYTSVDHYGRSVIESGGATNAENYLYFYNTNAAAVLFAGSGISSYASDLNGWMEPQTSSGAWAVSDLASSYFMQKVNSNPTSNVYSGTLNIANSGALSSFAQDTGGDTWADWDEDLGNYHGSSYTGALAPDSTLDPKGAYSIFDVNLTANGVTTISQYCAAISVDDASSSTAKGKAVCVDINSNPGLMIVEE
jgi:hypothetical protein